MLSLRRGLPRLSPQSLTQLHRRCLRSGDGRPLLGASPAHTTAHRVALRHCTTATTTTNAAAAAASSINTNSVDSKGHLHNSTQVADALRAARDGPLKSRLEAARAELATMEKIKAECDAAAQRLPDRRMRQLFAFLVVQAAVLLDWTYVHFDWNLVEPITYLIGYSATWIAIVWYGALQREFSFDAWRGMLEERQRRKLYAQHGLDVRQYAEVKVEVAKLEKVLRSLGPL